MNENRFYVYVHTCKDTGEVRYIGKGTGNRYKHKSNRTDKHRDIWETLDKKILLNNLSEETANEYEHRLITDAVKLGKNLLNVSKSKTIVKDINYLEFSKLFEYCETSLSGLVAKVDLPYSHKAGEQAGSLVNGGKDYWRIRYKKKLYMVHRIIYAIYHKIELNKNMVIDHIDGDHLNNKISNLQQVSRSRNNQKAAISARNTSGIKGVCWLNRFKTWSVNWYENREEKSKVFNPRKLYPGQDPDTAKQMAFNDAVEYRKKMIELHYGQSSQIGEIP